LVSDECPRNVHGSWIVAGFRYNELPPDEQGALPEEADLVRIVEEAMRGDEGD
jgi:hypothetical protein